MKVGFVGAGRMGAPMVRRLVEVGHEVVVLCQTDEKRFAITEMGARTTDDLLAVATEADAVVICVSTDEQIRKVCLHDGLLAAMAPGSVLILHTTGSPQTARGIATQSDRVGVVDAPISGHPRDVAAGNITLFIGGDDEAVSRAQPVLSAYGDPVLHVGVTGAGQLVKLVNNALFAAQIGLVAEGVRLGETFGIDESTLLGALTHGSSESRVLSLIAQAGSASAFIAAVGEFVVKDLAVIRQTAAELGAELGVLGSAADAGYPLAASARSWSSRWPRKELPTVR